MGSKGKTITTNRIKTCPQCGKDFCCPFGTGIGVWNKRTWCSSKCFGLSKRTRIKKNCLFCGKEFETTYERVKYCSVRCVNNDSKNKKHRKGLNHPNYHRIEKYCEVCGKKFLVIPARLKSAKCSRECASLWSSITRNGENCQCWRGGISFEDYDIGFNLRLKEFIRNRDNRKCQHCGRDEKLFDYRLVVHHIDYDKKNSSPDNLISLCRNCHVATNHYREKWIKYFTDRKEVYGYTPRI